MKPVKNGFSNQMKDEENMPGWPVYDQEQIDAVVNVLSSGKVNYWTGNETSQFEKEFAVASGVSRAVAVSNGSVALELALHAIGVASGDEVIVTPRSFIASASSVVLCGATPVFADVDRDSQNLTAGSIQAAISKKTKAVILVHHAGWPCQMDEILEVVQSSGIKVIEDCAQAHGARFESRVVGSFGDIGTYSFCQDKIISTGGEGGMIVTDDTELWHRAWSYKDHGKSYDAVHRNEESQGFRWLHESFGTNWRMTEMQSAIGRLQLKQLMSWHEKRRRNAEILMQRFLNIRAIRVVHPDVNVDHAYYRFYVFVRPEYLRKGWTRNRIMTEICAQGVPCFSGSCPEIYREVAFTKAKMVPNSRLSVAQELGETSLAFLVHPTLTAVDMQRVASVVEGVLDKASR